MAAGVADGLAAAVVFVVGCDAPDDEHEGRGDAIRQARTDGLTRARTERIKYRRFQPRTRTAPGWVFLTANAALSQTHVT